MSKAPRKCPMCGEKKNWKLIEKTKKGFSGGKAVTGAVLFGPVGLVGGAFGKKHKTYACAKCGFSHEYRK